MSDKPTVSLESGRAYYRASAISLPPFCLAAGRMGYEQMPPPARLKEKFEEGHRWEPAIIRRAASNLGMKVVSELSGEQYEFVIPIGTRAAIRGHIDAILEDESGVRYGFEAKALGQSFMDIIRRKGIKGIDHYSAQLTCYMAGFPELSPTWFFACQDKTAPETDPEVRPYDTPPENIDLLKAKVALVEAGVRAGKDFTEFEYHSHGFCPYWYLHPDKDEEAPSITEDELLDTLSQAYDDARDEEKQAKAKKELVRQQILDALGEKERVDTNKWKVEAKAVTSERFDQRGFAEAEPELYQKWKKPSTSVRVTVKGRGA